MTMIKKYRKKPVEIEAIQFSGWNYGEIFDWINDNINSVQPICYKETIQINTSEGVMTASVGDYIIKGIKGEFYPCKPDIFRERYTCLHQ